MACNGHLTTYEQIVIAAVSAEALISAIALSFKLNCSLDIHTGIATHVDDEVIKLCSSCLSVAIFHEVKLTIIHVGISSNN